MKAAGKSHEASSAGRLIQHKASYVVHLTLLKTPTSLNLWTFHSELKFTPSFFFPDSSSCLLYRSGLDLLHHYIQKCKLKRKKRNHIYVMKCLCLDCGWKADPVLYFILNNLSLQHACVLLALLSVTGNTCGQKCKCYKLQHGFCYEFVHC